MKLIVGLGNPGRKYAKTRHNMGFLVLDLIAEWAKVDIDKADFKGDFARFKRNDEDIILFKPSTYMNLSGEAVLAITNFFKIAPEDIIVILDDIALPPGSLRLREKGSSGGQKGLKNILELMHTNEIKRIRIGTGAPPQGEVVDYVLSKPSKEDWALIEPTLLLARDAVIEILDRGFTAAMTKFN